MIIITILVIISCDLILQVVANFYGSTNTYEELQPVKWPAGATEAPLDEPFCGFDNENLECSIQGKEPVGYGDSAPVFSIEKSA